MRSAESFTAEEVLTEKPAKGWVLACLEGERKSLEQNRLKGKTRGWEDQGINMIFMSSSLECTHFKLSCQVFLLLFTSPSFDMMKSQQESRCGFVPLTNEVHFGTQLEKKITSIPENLS